MSFFYIAEFDDGVQMVPNSWFSTNKDKCYWPNEKMNQIKLNKFIASHQAPDPEHWQLHRVLRIFGTAINYEKGIEKLKLAMEFSDIESAKSGAEKKKRKRRKLEFSDSSDEDNVVKKPAELDSPLLPECTLAKYVQQEIPASVTASPLCSSDDYNTAKEDLPERSNKEFRHLMLKKLNCISSRLKILEEKMDLLKTHCTPEARPKSLELNLFPLNTELEIQSLEQMLLDDEAPVINELKYIGGRGEYQVVTNILKKVMTDALAEEYSWAGAKRKKAFKCLKLSQIILQIVRIHLPTVIDEKVATITANWLKYAKQRKERNEIKLKEAL